MVVFFYAFARMAHVACRSWARLYCCFVFGRSRVRVCTQRYRTYCIYHLKDAILSCEKCTKISLCLNVGTFVVQEWGRKVAVATTVGLLYDTSFVSPFWCPELQGGLLDFWKICVLVK
jgi:hypothetical protein